MRSKNDNTTVETQWEIKGIGTPAERTAVFTLSTFKGEAVVSCDRGSVRAKDNWPVSFVSPQVSLNPSLSVKENCLLATVEGPVEDDLGGFHCD